MSFKVEATPLFLVEAKRLAKRYPSLKNDIALLAEELSNDPNQGTPLGKGAFKIEWLSLLKEKVKVEAPE
ncbi:MAG TPA: hypothetical protein VIM65_20265 [Cyclobacteriaceae bacterium]